MSENKDYSLITIGEAVRQHDESGLVFKLNDGKVTGSYHERVTGGNHGRRHKVLLHEAQR